MAAGGPAALRMGKSGSNSGLIGPAALYALFAACVIAIPQAFYGYYYAVHQDLAGSALSGRLVVELGSTFSEYSLYFPPAEKAWFSLAAWLSDLTGLRVDLTVIAMTSLAVIVSTVLAYRIRQQTVGASPLFLILSAIVLLALPVLFKNIFGLREHLVALGLWPYLMLRLCDPVGNKIGLKTRFLVGLWLGAMLLFKYFYSIAVLLVELVDAAIERNPALLFRITNLVAGGMVALYLLLWLGIDPSQREVIGAVAGAIEANLDDPRKNLNSSLAYFSLALLFLIQARFGKWPVRETGIMLALVLSTIIVAAIQARWYSHHEFPVVLAYVMWWWLAFGRLRLWVHTLIALFLGLSTAAEVYKTRTYQWEVREVTQAMGEEFSLDGKRVGLLSVHPSPYNEYLAEQGAMRWNTSMNNSYVATELQPFDKQENRGAPPPPVKLEGAGSQMLHDNMLTLWEDMPPDALIFDTGKSWPLRYTRIDWVHVFSEDERFTSFMEGYRPVFEHEGDRLRFVYYERVDQRGAE